MKKLILMGLFLFTSGAMAVIPWEVTLEELSSSGKSVVVDRGVLAGLEEGSLGKFYVQRGPMESPKIFLVAEGEVIKSFPKKSYWMMKAIHIPRALEAGQKILLVVSSELLKGRSLTLKKRHVVLPPKDEVDIYLDQNEKSTPLRLAKERAHYDPTLDLYEEDPHQEADVEVTTYEHFQETSGEKYSKEYGDAIVERYFVGGREVPLGDIKKAQDKKLFDSVASGIAAKTNAMKYGLKGLYREQEKDPGMRELNQKMSIQSVYDQAREEKRAQSEISPRAIAKMKRDGEAWSADMDDDTLRRYFIQTGLEREARRRMLALSELDGHELKFHFANGMIDHGNADDPANHGRGHALGIAYEWHLSRAQANLKEWSIEFVLEESAGDYDFGGANAHSDELSYGAYLNYYFINNPLTLNAFSWMVGLGVKNGRAKVSAADFAREYSYQLLTLPALQLMTKYRVHTGDLADDNVNVGLSVNFALNLDVKNLALGGSAEDDINSNISVKDLKYTVGMSVYF